MNELIATFGINWKLLLAQAFNFGVLLLALWWFLYRPVLNMIARRQRVIEEGVRNAQAAEKKLAAAHAEGEQIVVRAGKEAETMITQVRLRAKEKQAQLTREAEEQAERIVREAHTRSEEEKRRALEESKQDVAKAAVLAAEKIMRTQRI
jgi:F-type H+-transporting ATPase subunit b